MLLFCFYYARAPSMKLKPVWTQIKYEEALSLDLQNCYAEPGCQLKSYLRFKESTENTASNKQICSKDVCHLLSFIHISFFPINPH